MAVFVIGYAEAARVHTAEDGLDQAYGKFDRAISDLLGVRHIEVGQTWIVKAETTSDQIRDRLTSRLGTPGRLVVASLGQDAAWSGLGPDESEWLLAHM